MTDISTLVQDVDDLIEHRSGVEGDIIGNFTRRLNEMLHHRFNGPPRGHELSLSAVGTPCKKKLYHNVMEPERGEKLSAKVLQNFLYGNLIEEFYLFLAEAAGHKVTHRQEKVSVAGVPGSKDCHIDGVLVDVKSANGRSYKKFTKPGALDFDDPFGYKAQLQAYLEGSEGNMKLKYYDKAAFWVVNKERGGSVLYWIESAKRTGRDLKGEIHDIQIMLAKPTPPERGFAATADGKSGNFKLPIACSYCNHKQHCWDYRTFLYAGGPRFLTTTAVQPKVPEVVNGKVVPYVHAE